MTNSKSTKRALVTSALAILMCVAMLIGTTFAWFTDTASTGVNKIVSGNLKMEVSYKNTSDGEFAVLNENTNVFMENALWEPGHVEYAVLNVKNVGNLALKYKLGINIASETGSTNVNGKEFKLSDYIKFAVIDGEADVTDRDALVAAAEAADSKLINEGYSKESQLKTATDTNEALKNDETVTLVVWMPTTVGNDANYAPGAAVPEINLGINVVATQYTYESDSFNDQYDKDAKYTEVIAAGKTFTSGKHTLTTGVTATDPNATAIKVSGTGTEVIIEDGTFDGGKGGNNRCIQADNGATVTIKDGTFTVGSDAKGTGNSVVLCKGGNVIIEGGFFYTNYNWDGFYYVLNQQNNNPGTITVKGGTFVNYDPSKGDDNLGGNFVADGYKVVSEAHGSDTWYTVVAE